MKDLIGGLLLLAGGYYFEGSILNGDPTKFFYAFDLLGGFLLLSGLYKLIRGTPADDR